MAINFSEKKGKKKEFINDKILVIYDISDDDTRNKIHDILVEELGAKIEAKSTYLINKNNLKKFEEKIAGINSNGSDHLFSVKSEVDSKNQSVLEKTTYF